MKLIFCEELRRMWRGFRFLYIAQAILLVVYAIFFFIPTQLPTVNKILGGLFYISIYPIFGFGVICYCVRYYRTHVGKQAPYYLTLPVSLSGRFWGQLLAVYLLEFGILLLAIPYCLFAIPPMMELMTVQPAGLPQAAVNYPQEFVRFVSQNPGVTILILFVLLLITLIDMLYGHIAYAAILQTLGDDRYRRLGLGAPILAWLVICVIQFALMLTPTVLLVLNWTTWSESFRMLYLVLSAAIVVPVITAALCYWFWYHSQNRHRSV